MADPKYQDLPYIAVGEPDVYETGDLPEADQALNDQECQDTVVEKLVVDPKDAFGRFNKATIDTSKTNFTESGAGALGSGNRTGYSVHYEVFPSSERDSESLLQKIQRLKCELNEIETIAKTNFNEPDVNPASVLSEIESLKRQVDSLPSPSLVSSESNTQAYNKLLTQLKSLPPKGSPKKTASATGKDDTTVFELNYMPQVTQLSKEANLEARVMQLEKLVGSQSGDQRPLSESVSGESVMDAIAVLSSKMHLLDEDKVDKLSARLQILSQSLNKVSESSSAAETNDLDKVNELYELVKKWDGVCDSLPSIVDRLYTLQDLHQQAMEFSSTLKALEASQTELTQNVTNHNQLLTDLHKTFSKNVDVIKSNVEGLEKRMDALKK